MMQAPKTPDWYKSWFNSPYYHVLYKNRDDEEARLFLDNLIGYLKPDAGATILDMPCGKGRHSIYLNSKGYDVTGIDLSKESIVAARLHENDTLAFYEHDMRHTFRVNYYDYVLNLFTSIGYFERDSENAHVVGTAAQALRKGGSLVIDFMNVPKIQANLVGSEHKRINGINFELHRRIEEGFIVKDIRFTHNDVYHHYAERVKALQIADFERYFTKAGLKTLVMFGDYQLNPYRENMSDRLILIAQKQ